MSRLLSRWRFTRVALFEAAATRFHIADRLSVPAGCFVVLCLLGSSAPAFGQCPCSVWSATAVPSNPAEPDSSPVELGLKFRTTTSGFVKGVRFYKGPGNTGTHVGHLWTRTGTLLATATFSSETASGWQQVSFSAPVAVAAGTTYIVSYFAPNGNYAGDNGFFAQGGVDNGPLRALANGEDGGNGVYLYASNGGFPTQTFSSTNYWVDVVFDFTATDTTPPTVTTVSPAAGAVGVSLGPTVTATFSEQLAAATLNGSTFFLTDPSANTVPASVAYSTGSLTATLTPTIELEPFTVYTVTIKGGSTSPRVTDLAGNPLAANRTWSFTTGAPPPTEGPGGPILVITSTASPFSRYYAEILRAEGLNQFTIADIASVSAAVLAGYDVAILGNFSLTTAQATMLTDWVTGGGNLVAMRPDKQLAGFLGLADASTTLSNAYLLINTSSGPGTGLVNQTIQFHGTADRYGLAGATALATLYANATTATSAPAVTLRTVGLGQAAAFTYDLARSVVYTRQGNPAWSGQERDGTSPIRSDDLFYGASAADPQRDWVDLSKVAIPQADEQQRLLANLIVRMNLAKRPLPRFWYLPRDLKAAVVMTGDDHGNNGTAGRFAAEVARSTPGCSVDDWRCIRSTSYVYPGTLSNAVAASYVGQGFEVGLHVNTNCANWTPAQLESFYGDQLGAWSSSFSSLPSPVTNRTHCISWSDYDTQPQVELSHGIRFDTNYYYWPGAWANDRPGFFTGSGMPMRFTTRNGDLLDVYQATTQMTDESAQSYPFTINTLLDNALGPQGYYGAFVANMHTDTATPAGWNAIVTSAQSRGVPVVSAAQMLQWLDGRNGSSFGSLNWDGQVLRFSISAAGGTNGLRSMLPASTGGGSLSGLTFNGSPIPYTTSLIKGIQYVSFDARTGAYEATYGGALPTASLTPASLTFAAQPLGTTSAPQAVVLRNTGSVPLAIQSIAVSGDYSQSNTCGPSLNAGAQCTISVTFTPTVGGTRTGTLTVTDSGAGSPRTVSLSGSGTGTLPSTTWFAGDMHVHRSCGGTAESPSSVLTRVANNATDLAVISLLADMGNGEVQNPLVDLPKVGTSDPVSTPSRIVQWDAEWHWDATYTQFAHQALGGHIVALGLSPQSGQQIWEEYTYPIFQWAHQRGGIAGFAHFQYLDAGIPNTLTCCTPIEYPVEVALGSVDFISEDVQGSDETLTAYYRLLNTGFRPALTAGTDYPCGINTVGSLSTYVRIPDGQLTYSKWVDGIAAGRTVVSRNGTNEFLDLTVNGNARPGDEIQLTGGGSVPVTIQWTSKQNVSGTIELVMNGNVVASWTASAGPGAPAVRSTTVAFTKSGWLAARRMEANSHRVHTGALFVIVGGAPVRTSVTDAQFYVQWIDTLLQRTSPGGVWNSFFPTKLAEAQARYQAAKTIFQQIAAEAGGSSVSFTPASGLTFAAQPTGTTSAAQTVTLSNTGTGSLAISSIAITGAAAGDFARTHNCPATLAAGGSCTITVTFTPTAAGTRTAALTVTDNAAGSPHGVPLTGTGTAASTVTLSPTSLTFGSQVIGTTSAGQTVTLSNTGTGPLSISSIAVTGGNAADFARTHNCPASLAAGANCTIAVTFTPTATGTRTSALAVTDNAAGSPHSVTLTGTGTVALTVNLAPAALTFGSQVIGTTSAAQAVTLSNTGSGPLAITSIALTGAAAGDFAQTHNCPASLAAGGNCTITVTFTPTVSGNRSAALTITDNAPGSPHSVTLTGTGTVASTVSLAPAALTFASQLVGTTSAGQPVTLTNTGSGPVAISSIALTGTAAGDFARTHNCPASLAAGANCTITVTFTPTAAGTRTAAVSVTDDAAGSPHSVALTGTGTVASAVTLSPTSLTFAGQRVGTTSNPSSITLTNTGTAPLAITGVSIGGTNAGDFSQTNTCPSSLAPAASCSIAVRFTPTAAGPRTATLTVADDAAGSPHTVSLSGTGTLGTAVLSPSSLAFGSQAVGTVSSVQTVTLTNGGTATLAISSITVTGANSNQFTQTTTCKNNLAIGNSCTISVRFAPTTTGDKVAALSISDNAVDSPQTVALTGTGTSSATGPALTVSPTSVAFPGQAVGTTSAPSVITLTSTGSQAVTFSSFALGGANAADFAVVSNTCSGVVLTTPASCTISVTFAPQGTGSRTATLSISNNAAGSPQAINLSGSGKKR